MGSPSKIREEKLKEDTEVLRRDLADLVSELEAFPIRDIPLPTRGSPWGIPDKLLIYKQASLLRSRLLLKGVACEVDRGNVPASLACLRAFVEEVASYTFLLSELRERLDGKATLDEVSEFLNRISTGRKTRPRPGVTPKPFHINDMLRSADRLFETLLPELSGVLWDTYTFVSDLVHPNSPARYQFWKLKGDHAVFVEKGDLLRDDLWMILNYTAMAGKLYLIVIGRLDDLITDLEDSSSSSPLVR